MNKCYAVIIFNLRKPRVPNFADIIKIAVTFIKTNLKDSKKEKVFLDMIKIVYFWLKNVDISGTQVGCQVCYMFLYLLYVRYNRAKLNYFGSSGLSLIKHI